MEYQSVNPNTGKTDKTFPELTNEELEAKIATATETYLTWKNAGYAARAAIVAKTEEQVLSLGATFVQTGVDAQGKGGYARELTPEEKTKVAAVLTKHIAQADLIITTAADDRRHGGRRGGQPEARAGEDAGCRPYVQRQDERSGGGS